MKFAAFNDEAIYGIGATEAEACIDAAQWLDQTIPQQDRDAQIAAMRVLPITKELEKRVDELGGDVPFHIVNGALTAKSDEP